MKTVLFIIGIRGTVLSVVVRAGNMKCMTKGVLPFLIPPVITLFLPRVLTGGV